MGSTARAAQFTKLHASILDSSIWGQPDHVRLVWITLLAMADEDGVVQASLDGIARRAVVALDLASDAIGRFMGPDPHSRDGTTGERVTKVPGGWLILNHKDYRDVRTKEQILTAKRVAEHRKRKTLLVTGVTERNPTSTPEAEAEAEAEAEVPSPSEKGTRAARSAVAVARPDDVPEDLWAEFKRVRGKPLTPRAMNGILSEVRKAGWTLTAALEKCVARGWRGFEASWVTENRTNGHRVPTPENLATKDYGKSRDL